jgi:hypothetical protein
MATNSLALLPGRNPAGSTVAGDYSISPAIGSTSGQNPILPPPNIPSGAPATNPYAPGSVVPTSGIGTAPAFGANSGGYSPTNLAGPGAGTGAPPGSTGIGGTLAGVTPGGWNDFLHELDKTYGEGTGSLIGSLFQSGFGFNQSAVNNLLAALQPGIERGTESLAEQFSASGNRFGSGAQIGIADYLSQVQLNEGQIETQMYEQSVQDMISTLMGVAGGNEKRIASSPSTLDTILSGLNLGGAAAGGASAGISAANPNADTSILDTIASIGGL